MYATDPAQIERTWSLTHVVVALRVIEYRQRREREHAEEVRSRG